MMTTITKLTAQYLGWLVLFDRDLNGWKFEATRPNCDETLTSGLYYPTVDLAHMDAKHLLESYQTQAQLGNWLETLRQKQEISADGFNQGLEIISRFAAKPLRSDL